MDSRSGGWSRINIPRHLPSQVPFHLPFFGFSCDVPLDLPLDLPPCANFPPDLLLVTPL
jgi:hypothetical protein